MAYAYLSREVDTEASSTATVTNDCYPSEGKTYIIRHKPTQKIITVIEGALATAQQDSKTCGGSLWTCIRRAGWFQFKNLVSGTFIGFRTPWCGDFAVGKDEFGHCSNFCPPYRLGGEGGYILALPIGRPSRRGYGGDNGVAVHDSMLVYLGLHDDGKISSLKAQGEASSWEFVEV